MSLFGALSVSASGMAAQRTRAELIVENMANSETTRTAAGGPYRRKLAVFESQPQSPEFASVFQTEIQPEGVGVADVVIDAREPVKRYLPGHPDAGEDGYVSYPNLSPVEEMVDLVGASRGYQANVAAMAAVKEMIHRSLDLLR